MSLRSTLLEVLADFGPVNHRMDPMNVADSAPGAPSVNYGPVRDEIYIHSVYNGSMARGVLPGYRDIVAQAPGAYRAPLTVDQKNYMLDTWSEFIDGVCAHPCQNVRRTKVMCATRACTDEKVTDVTTPCVEYTINTAAGCYCVDLLKSELGGSNIFSTVVRLATESPLCSDLLLNYAFATASYYVMVGAVVVINWVLGEVLKKVAMLQAPASWSQYFSRTSTGIFWARFVNNGILIMLVNANGLANVENVSPGVFDGLRFLGVLDGDFSDFSSSWYGRNGTHASTIIAMHVCVCVRVSFVSVFFTQQAGARKQCVYFPSACVCARVCVFCFSWGLGMPLSVAYSSL